MKEKSSLTRDGENVGDVVNAISGALSNDFASLHDSMENTRESLAAQAVNIQERLQKLAAAMAALSGKIERGGYSRPGEAARSADSESLRDILTAIEERLDRQQEQIAILARNEEKLLQALNLFASLADSFWRKISK